MVFVSALNIFSDLDQANLRDFSSFFSVDNDSDFYRVFAWPILKTDSPSARKMNGIYISTL
jgi:hypothetical protein